MKIGDIILTAGDGPLSRLIKTYNRVVMRKTGPAAEISHVAMVGPDAVSVFEATTHNKWANNGYGKKGVQSNPYEEWVRNYEGMIWIREQIPDTIKISQIATMYRAMIDRIGRPYENGIPGALELAFAGWQIPGLSKWWRERLKTKTNLHCSEADAEVLVAGGILPEWCRPNKLPPCLWWSEIKELDRYYKMPKEIKP